jgi:uncharacterized protein
VRIPGWTTEDAQVKINGRPLEAMADPGSYLAIRRMWQDGDTIAISLPMSCVRSRCPAMTLSLPRFYGPLVLAADLGAAPTDESFRIIHSGDTVPKNLPAADPLPKVAAEPEGKTEQWIAVDSKEDLRFTAAAGERKAPTDAFV